MASISVDHLGQDRYKIRWRELVPGPDGPPERGADGRLQRRSRSLTVLGKAARDQAVDRIRRALLDEGEFQPPTASTASTSANLEQAALAWLQWKRTRCKPRSVVSYAGHLKRFFGRVRELRGIGRDEPVQASAISRDLVIDCLRGWQSQGLSASWIYSVGRTILDMWRWVSDDPERYPGVPVPPREAKMVLPRVPIYVAPPAPTMDEMDACLRHLGPRAHGTRLVGVVLRFTGLRISQILAIRRRDLDMETGTLVVTVGKSRQEEAERRTIPVSAHLASEIRSCAAGLDGDDFLLGARGCRQRPGSRKVESLQRAWKSATEAGEAREVVWRPANRKIGRPEHAFRAGLQAFMRRGGVDEEVIDAIVGHGGRSVRSRHYAGPESLWDRMVEAMETVPAIRWTPPGAPGNVVGIHEGTTARRRA